MKSKTILYALALIVILFLFFAWLMRLIAIRSTPTAVVTLNSTATPRLPQNQLLTVLGEETAVSPGLLQPYYNATADFSLLLPLDWVVGDAQTTAWGEQIPLGKDTPEGSTILITDAASRTIDEMLTAVICDPCDIKEHREITLHSSQLTTQRIMLDNTGKRDDEWFFIEHNNKLIALFINNVRTEESLDAIIHSFTPGPTADMSVEEITAVQAARQHLASQFGLDPYNVIVLSWETAVWDNTCLDVSLPQLACTQSTTTGYILNLRLGGQEYVYHTTQDGSFTAPRYPIGY